MFKLVGIKLGPDETVPCPLLMQGLSVSISIGPSGRCKKPRASRRLARRFAKENRP